MNGLYTKEMKQLVMDVSKGNPGALRVCDELTWFTNWYKMMVWCKRFLSGSDLWVKYKDDFGCDVHLLGAWLNQRLHTEARNEEIDSEALNQLTKSFKNGTNKTVKKHNILVVGEAF